MITIIPKEEAPEILPVSRGRNTLLRVMLMQMKVGEILVLPKEDWKTKNSPRYIIAYLRKKTSLRYDYGKSIDGKGWQFRRVA